MVSEHRGLMARMSSFGRWLLLAVLVCAASVVVFRQLIVDRLDEEIRVRVEARLAAHYRGLEVRIEGARRIEGKGIEIRGLSLRAPAGASHRELVYIDEMFLECRAELSELVRNQLCARRLTLRRMKLHATCFQDGHWNLSTLLPLPDFGGNVPKIVVEDSTLELQDLCRQNGCVWVLRNIDLQLQAKTLEGRHQWEIGGSLRGDHFKNIKLQGRVDPQTGSWLAGGTIDGLDMSQRFLDALPNDVAQYVSMLASLRARAHFEFKVGHRPGDPEPLWAEVHGHLSDGRVDDARLPAPWTHLEADIHGDTQTLRIQNVTARSGSTTLHMDCVCEGYLQGSPRLRLAAEVTNLTLEERLRAALPESWHAEWDKFLPGGVIDATIGLTIQQGQVLPDIAVHCRDVSFAFHKFPLRMHNGTGSIQWSGNQLTFSDFTALAGSQVVKLSGQFENPGRQATGWLELHSDGPIELDHNLIAAMNETGQRIMRSLKPSGQITLTRGRIDKLTPDAEPTSRWELALEDCSIEYEKFPYAIHKITGHLVLENRRWEFSDLRGYHGSSYITCNGTWEPLYADQPGGVLTLGFTCWDVPLNDSLRHAVGNLKPGAERFWDSMRPRGTVDRAELTFQFNSETKQSHFDLLAEKWPPSQNVDGRSITVHPQWFAVQADDCVGRVRFRDGVFWLEKVSARRGATQLELDGWGRVLPNDQWEVALTQFFVDSMIVDHELIEALPATLGQGVRQLRYRGGLSLNGNCWFRGGPGQELAAGWDVLLDINNGSLDNQLKIQSIFGSVRLTGGKDAQGARSRGLLDVDSLMTHGVQLTQVNGPLWIDAQRLVLGSRVSVLARDRIPRQVVAKAMGGTLTVDAEVALDEALRFVTDLSLSDAAATEFARSFHSERHDISGKVNAVVHLQGAKAGLHTLQGRGEVHLREADIYELPVMAGLLNLLSLRPPDTTGFTSSDVAFHLQDEQVYLDRVDVRGDVISLKGHGWMDLNRQVNLDFYALVGNQEFQIPVIRNLLAQASKSILRIQVVGDVNNPQVIKRPLPELDDTLQRLFPEAAPRTAGR